MLRQVNPTIWTKKPLGEDSVTLCQLWESLQTSSEDLDVYKLLVVTSNGKKQSAEAHINIFLFEPIRFYNNILQAS